MLRVTSPQPPPRGGIKSARDFVGHKKSKRNTPSEIKSRASVTLAAVAVARVAGSFALCRARAKAVAIAPSKPPTITRAPSPGKSSSKSTNVAAAAAARGRKSLSSTTSKSGVGANAAKTSRSDGGGARAAIGAARGGVVFLDFGEPHFGDRSRAVGRSFESRIVQHDQFAVGGEVGVEFDRIDSQTRRADKSGHRVFGKKPAAAAMRDKQRPRAGAKNGKRGGRRQFGGAARGRKPES